MSRDVCEGLLARTLVCNNLAASRLHFGPIKFQMGFALENVGGGLPIKLLFIVELEQVKGMK